MTYTQQPSVAKHARSLSDSGASLLETAQGCRASNFTAKQCAPELYALFPGTSANDMGEVLVEVWACELSEADLTAALQSCQSGGQPAYSAAAISASIAASMTLTYLDVAHIPTSYGGVDNGELRMLGLSQGDLAGIKEAEAARFLLFSCLPGDYTPTPGSLIAALQSAYGINVAQLAQDPAADYRATHHCWISKPMSGEGTATIPYQQLICFESTGSAAPANIPGVFAAIKEYIPDPAPLPNTGPTVISGLLSTGGAGGDKSAVLTALFNGCWDLMKTAPEYNISCFRITIYPTEWEQSLTQLFEQLKSQHGLSA